MYVPLMAIGSDLRRPRERIGWMAPISSWDCRWCGSVRMLHVLGHGLRHAVLVIGEPTAANIFLGYGLDDASTACFAMLGAGTGLAGAYDVLALDATDGVAVLVQVAVLEPEASDGLRSRRLGCRCGRNRFAEEYLRV